MLFATNANNEVIKKRTGLRKCRIAYSLRRSKKILKRYHQKLSIELCSEHHTFYCRIQQFQGRNDSPRKSHITCYLQFTKENIVDVKATFDYNIASKRWCTPRTSNCTLCECFSQYSAILKSLSKRPGCLHYMEEAQGYWDWDICPACVVWY